MITSLEVKFDHFAKSIFQITYGVSLYQKIKLKNLSNLTLPNLNLPDTQQALVAIGNTP